MAKYLDTSDRSMFAIGICDRCRLKFSLLDLKQDHDNENLRVCRGCRDHVDHNKFPRRIRDENTPLPFTRPDLDPDGPDGTYQNIPVGIITEDDSGFVKDEFGNWIIP